MGVEFGHMDGKVCLVTGASTGIGLASAMALGQLGATLILTCRDMTRGQEALRQIKAKTPDAKVELILADFASLAEVRRLAAEVKTRCSALDVLINNAGLLAFKYSKTKDGFESTFGVNHLAPFLLTHLLLDHLAAPARIVNVASEAHDGRSVDWGNLQGEISYNPREAYGVSKLLNVLFSFELARRLDPAKTTVTVLHPGFIPSTNLFRTLPGVAKVVLSLLSPLIKKPDYGARTVVYLATSTAVAGVSGKYYDNCREYEASPQARDAASAGKLWDLSERLCGIQAPEAAHA